MLPTEKRVAEMLKATSHKPDEIVGRMAPSTPHEAWEYTVEMVAANAVMSGAKAGVLPRDPGVGFNRSDFAGQFYVLVCQDGFV